MFYSFKSLDILDNKELINITYIVRVSLFIIKAKNMDRAIQKFIKQEYKENWSYDIVLFNN